MIVRAVDYNHDWTFGRGRQSYKQEQEAIMQTVKTRLMSIFADCFFDVDAGIDWLRLLSNPGTLEEIRLSCRSIIARTDGVLRVHSVDVIQAGRRVDITFSVDTEYTDNVESSLGVGDA